MCRRRPSSSATIDVVVVVVVMIVVVVVVIVVVVIVVVFASDPSTAMYVRHYSPYLRLSRMSILEQSRGRSFHEHPEAPLA